MRLTLKLLTVTLTMVFATAVRAQDADNVSMLKDRSAAGELAYWNSIKDTADVQNFRTYLVNFPDGMFFDPAMEKYTDAGGEKSALPQSVLQPQVASLTEDDTTEVAAPAPVKTKKVVRIKPKATVAAKPAGKKAKKVAACVSKSIYSDSCKVTKRKVASNTKKKKVPLTGGSGGASTGKSDGWGGGGGSPGGGGSSGSGSGGWGGG